MLATYRGTAPAPVNMVAVSPGIDVEAAVRAAAALLAALGVPDGSEAAVRTPGRMVAGLAELLSSSPWEFATFPNREGQHELVLARDVPFTSVCAHHLLPFSGVAQVGVLPGERIAGLPELARAVEAFAGRMQVQVELGQQIAPARPCEREINRTWRGIPRDRPDILAVASPGPC